MPIWFELLVLLLVTYVIGLAVGWLLCGRAMVPEISDARQDQEEIRE